MIQTPWKCIAQPESVDIKTKRALSSVQWKAPDLESSSQDLNYDLVEHFSRTLSVHRYGSISSIHCNIDARDRQFWVQNPEKKCVRTLWMTPKH